ncbi:MAG: hypothetical protein GY857_06415 [Desulfobacula sp.]|nr:hypothetical protein [Desulfobacula sp.]
MEINNMQGANAYTTSPGATPPVDNMQAQNKDLEASRTDINPENTDTSKKAFEVSITQEAQDLLAAQATREPAETQTKTPEDQTTEEIEPTPENSRIMNIVA